MEKMQKLAEKSKKELELQFRMVYLDDVEMSRERELQLGGVGRHRRGEGEKEEKLQTSANYIRGP